MRNPLLFSVLLSFCFLAGTSVSAGPGDDEKKCPQEKEHEIRLDAFHEILEHENIPFSEFRLPMNLFQEFIDEVFDKLTCGDQNSASTGCDKSMCVAASDVITVLGGSAAATHVTDEQFTNATLVLFYHILQLDHYCHGDVNTSVALSDMEDFVLKSMELDSTGDHPIVRKSGIEHMLESIEGHLKNKDEDSSSHEDDDHGHDGPGGDKPMVARRRRGADHDDGDDDHDHEEFKLVVKEKCMSADAVLFYVGEDNEDFVESDMLYEIVSGVVYLIAEGAKVEGKCRSIPQKKAFFLNLIKHFSHEEFTMDSYDLNLLMTRLNINPEEPGEHDHDHRRRRRAATKLAGMSAALRRSRRDVAVNPEFTKCYKASELMALYEAPSNIGQESFQQICPSLINQIVFGDCGQHDDDHDDVSEAEKYGYGSIATALICLTSIAGVVVIPCTSESVYNAIMALFMGLAVGTLFGDAVLHLIPLAFGLHSHEGHDHDHDVRVEKHVQLGLAVLATVYVFFLLEVFMSKYGGHTHELDQHGQPAIGNENKYVDADGKVVEKSANTEMNGHATDAKTEKKKGLHPVAVMILAGDSLHNFADGLALGAAFTESISTGIGISVAIFCHELPHELGDFAVLLKSGLSFKKALIFNLLSGMTAFIGLYVGIAISTDDEVKVWIFAVTAGVFFYIALVDMLPILIRTKGSFPMFLNNVGILFGFACMFVIAVYEEHIEV